MKKFVKMLSVILVLVMMVAIIPACTSTAPQKTSTPPTTPSAPAAPAAAAPAPASNKMVLRYSELAEASHPMSGYAKYFADQVKTLSNGRITIEVYTGAQLGAEKDSAQATQMGSIDFARVGTAMLVDFGLDELKAINVPFLFRDREHCWKVLGGEIGQTIKENVNKRDTGLVGLWFAEEGMRHMIFKKGPVTKLADFKGRKIRVNNANLMIDIINAMGASAVPMAYGEVYTSLQSGVIDGLENIVVGYQQSALYEVAPYYTLDGHLTSIVMACASAKSWNKFSDADRDIIKKASVETEKFAQQTAAQKESESMKIVKDKGATISEVADRQEWIKALQPVVDKYAGNYKDLIEKIRNVK